MEGFTAPKKFVGDSIKSLDVNLWSLASRDMNAQKVAEISKYLKGRGAEISDNFISREIVQMRVQCPAKLIPDLLSLDMVMSLDSPPTSFVTIDDKNELALADLDIQAAPDDAGLLAILDSGITSGHPALRDCVGEAISVPGSLGDASDRRGHGTKVAGIGVYFDVDACIAAKKFAPELKVLSARVVNEHGRFDHEKLVVTQMKDAIRHFHDDYGCRVFNISLGDPNQYYQGGRLSAWASVLDEIARDMDVVIVVSAGNIEGDLPVVRYPDYLLEDGHSIVEPATACNVLTVGALAGFDRIDPAKKPAVGVFEPIARADEPSPITRSGLGVGGAIKPDLCEIGGNLVYDGRTDQAHHHDDLAVVSLSNNPLQRLFSASVGTSFAAPRVAHLAARLLKDNTNASANLIRALIASSAEVPQAAKDRLQRLGEDAVLRVCGYGKPKLQDAAESALNRVILMADTEIDLNKFHVYELPIPDEFVATQGRRSIEINLAFDPPVRHTRFDYLGTAMNFRLVRGRTLDEVIEAFKKPDNEEVLDAEDSDPEDSHSVTGRFNCKLLPLPTVREKGTLQRAVFTMARNPNPGYGNTYHLVVRCVKKWAGESFGRQRYALVACVRHEAQIDIYNKIRSRVSQRVRVRAGSR